MIVCSTKANPGGRGCIEVTCKSRSSSQVACKGCASPTIAWRVRRKNDVRSRLHATDRCLESKLLNGADVENQSLLSDRLQVMELWIAREHTEETKSAHASTRAPTSPLAPRAVLRLAGVPPRSTISTPRVGIARCTGAKPSCWINLESNLLVRVVQTFLAGHWTGLGNSWRVRLF